MKNKLFKFISQDSLENSPLIAAITEKEAQEQAEELIGRKLTEAELESFEDTLFFGEDVDWRRLELLKIAILSVTGQWEIDEE